MNRTEYPSRHCVICGEPEGSSYAKHCCADPDNMEDE